MNWLAFGYCVVAAMVLAGVVVAVLAAMKVVNPAS